MIYGCKREAGCYPGRIVLYRLSANVFTYGANGITQAIVHYGGELIRAVQQLEHHTQVIQVSPNQSGLCLSASGRESQEWVEFGDRMRYRNPHRSGGGGYMPCVGGGE